MTGRRRFAAKIPAASTFSEGPCVAHDRHALMDAKTCPWVKKETPPAPCRKRLLDPEWNSGCHAFSEAARCGNQASRSTVFSSSSHGGIRSPHTCWMRERSSRELLGRLLGTGNSVAGTASSVGMRGTCHSGRGR